MAARIIVEVGHFFFTNILKKLVPKTSYLVGAGVSAGSQLAINHYTEPDTKVVFYKDEPKSTTPPPVQETHSLVELILVLLLAVLLFIAALLVHIGVRQRTRDRGAMEMQVRSAGPRRTPPSPV